jgi:hypothetical protein
VPIIAKASFLESKDVFIQLCYMDYWYFTQWHPSSCNTPAAFYTPNFTANTICFFIRVFQFCWGQLDNFHLISGNEREGGTLSQKITTCWQQNLIYERTKCKISTKYKWHLISGNDGVWLCSRRELHTGNQIWFIRKQNADNVQSSTSGCNYRSTQLHTEIGCSRTSISEHNR